MTPRADRRARAPGRLRGVQRGDGQRNGHDLRRARPLGQLGPRRRLRLPQHHQGARPSPRCSSRARCSTSSSRCARAWGCAPRPRGRRDLPPADVDRDRDGGVVRLLTDRDLSGTGIEVEMWGHRVRVAPGPAAFAIAAKTHRSPCCTPATSGSTAPDAGGELALGHGDGVRRGHPRPRGHQGGADRADVPGVGDASSPIASRRTPRTGTCCSDSGGSNEHRHRVPVLARPPRRRAAARDRPGGGAHRSRPRRVGAGARRAQRHAARLRRQPPAGPFPCTTTGRPRACTFGLVTAVEGAQVAARTATSTWCTSTSPARRRSASSRCGRGSARQWRRSTRRTTTPRSCGSEAVDQAGHGGARRAYRGVALRRAHRQGAPAAGRHPHHPQRRGHVRVRRGAARGPRGWARTTRRRSASSAASTSPARASTTFLAMIPLVRAEVPSAPVPGRGPLLRPRSRRKIRAAGAEVVGELDEDEKAALHGLGRRVLRAQPWRRELRHRPGGGDGGGRRRGRERPDRLPGRRHGPGARSPCIALPASATPRTWPRP